jgi:glucokinase
MTDATYLVFETGGTKLVAGVAGQDCRILETRILYREHDDRAGTSLKRLVAAARELTEKHQQQGAAFRSVGFGFGGIVRRSTRDPYLCLHEDGWEELSVVETLEREFRLPVFVENDCKLAALAEAHFGAGRGHRTVFYVTLGTGVGGGIVRDGRIQTFSDVGEAEIGHVVVAPDGPACPCGNRGCVEALCSGPGVSRLAAWVAEQDGGLWSQSSLCKGHGRAEDISSKKIMEDWGLGDPFASAVADRAAGYLAQALGAVVNLISPDVVVVGGGLGTGNPRFLSLVSEKLRPQVVSYFRDQYQIVPCELREQVVSQGAAILASQSVGE